MKQRVLIGILAALMLPAFAEEPTAPVNSNLPAVELTPQIVYQIILAEIAGSRGQIALAAEAYGDLARSTRDPRIARRAAEAALVAGRHDQALAAARLWAEIEPESSSANQMVGALLAAAGRSDELAAHLARQLATAGPAVGPQLLQLNRALSRMSDKAALRQLVVKVTEPYVGLAEAHYARAQAAHAVGDRQGALEEIERTLALRPTWEYAALIRAQLMPGPAEASKVLGEFVTANPDAKDARLAYARSLVAEKRFDDARREFRILLSQNGDSTEIVYAVAVLSAQLNDYDDAEANFKRLLGTDFQETNSVRLYLGQIAEERKRWDEAVGWYDQVGAGAQLLAARMRIAQVRMRQGNLAEARKTLQETAATSADERSQLLVAEAQLLRDAKDHEGAYQVLADGLARHPDQPELLYEAALTAEKVGKLDVVERDLRRLIALRPDYAHAYNALGYSLADRNERLDEAQFLIEKALELAPQDPFIIDSKGWLLFRRGDGAAALEVLQKAFSMRADPEIAAHIGEVLWSLGRQDEARKTWNEAAKANPGNEALADTIKKFAKP